MTKKEILELTGLTESDFYKKYPTKESFNKDLDKYKYGGIHIKPENKGKFTAYANTHGKSVQRMASQVLANKEDYSPTIVKRANFAHNASKWNHQYGGMVEYKQGGTVQKLSKNNVVFNGKSHAQGGIPEPVVNGKKLKGIEVEGKETMSTDGNEKFIYSHNLGFAQKHLPLAKAIGKIEKKLAVNPNDPIQRRTLKALKEREEALKMEQEATKQQLGLENNLDEMSYGGPIKRKDGVYIDRQGVMQYPMMSGGLYKSAMGGSLSNSLTMYEAMNPNKDRILQSQSMFKNGGLFKAIDGLPPYETGEEPELPNWARSNPFQSQASVVKPSANNMFDINSIVGNTINQLKSKNASITSFKNNLTGLNKYRFKNPSINTPSQYPNFKTPSSGFNFLNKPVKNLPEDNVSKSNKFDWSKVGNILSKGQDLMPYLGVAKNMQLNKRFGKMTPPQQALTPNVNLNKVNYDTLRNEADVQRREANQLVSRDVTNSAVAAATRANMYGQMLSAKNKINLEENVQNTDIQNQQNILNNTIATQNARTAVENADRFYNRDVAQMTGQSSIYGNLSDIQQAQRRDKATSELENRKLDILKEDMKTGVHDRNLAYYSAADKYARDPNSLTPAEMAAYKAGPRSVEQPKMYGGKIKNSIKLFNKKKK